MFLRKDELSQLNSAQTLPNWAARAISTSAVRASQRMQLEQRSTSVMAYSNLVQPRRKTGL